MALLAIQMWLKRLSRRSQEPKEAGSLERKTAVPEDLLARPSWPFRRHSAPPQETRRAEEASLTSTRESSFAEAAETFNPADHFSHLPEPLQERILQELGVKVRRGSYLAFRQTPLSYILVLSGLTGHRYQKFEFDYLG